MNRTPKYGAVERFIVSLDVVMWVVLLLTSLGLLGYLLISLLDPEKW